MKLMNWVVICFIVIISSCGSKKEKLTSIFEKNLFDENQVITLISNGLEINKLQDTSNLSTISLPPFASDSINNQVISRVYKERFDQDKGLIWLGETNPTSALESFDRLRGLVKWHGLDSADYIPSNIDSGFQVVMASYKNSNTIDPQLASNVELGLTRGYIRLISDMIYGKSNPRAFFDHKEWSSLNDSAILINELVSKIELDNGADSTLVALIPIHPWYQSLQDEYVQILQYSGYHNLKPLDNLRDSIQIGDSSAAFQPISQRISLYYKGDSVNYTKRYDEQTAKWVKQLQRAHGIEDDGVIRQKLVTILNEPVDSKLNMLKSNLERWRWSRRDFEPEYVLVNLPAYRVFHFQNEIPNLAMNCVVGKVIRKSPTIDARMTDVVFNPTWTVPPTILEKDLLPGIQRRGGSAVARRGLVAYDRRGRAVNAGNINSGNYKNFSYRQKSGYNNALGTLKFNMPNRELVYLHDTNHRWGFNGKVRANSSGCVRLQHPKNMAVSILGPQGYTLEVIDSLIQKKVIKSVKLERDVMVHFRYYTAAPDSLGAIIYYPDVYHQDALMSSLWK